MKQYKDYNWKGTGPDGCDSHCIPHPCGKCIAPKLQHYLLKAAPELLEVCESMLSFMETLHWNDHEQTEYNIMLGKTKQAIRKAKGE